jgi:hypothetical protein
VGLAASSEPSGSVEVGFGFSPDELSDHGSCRRLHPGKDMRVLLQREGRRLVPEPLADDLDGHASLQRQRGMRMSQVVQSDRPNPG